MSFSIRYNEINDTIMLSFDGIDKEISLNKDDLELITKSYKEYSLENRIKDMKVKMDRFAYENKDTSMKKKSFIRMDIKEGPLVKELGWKYDYLFKDNLFDSMTIALDFLDKNHDDLNELFCLLKEEKGYR